MFGGRSNDDVAAPADAVNSVVPSSTEGVVTGGAPAVVAPPPLDAPDTPAPGPFTEDVAATPAVTTGDEDLLQIKQQALQQLSPLVGHLEQSPEDKFRTTMMMIQASDDRTLIKEAYTAAQAITDEKVRAQALLDIVNEINYFTQQGQTHPAEMSA